jgi:hypothetical protein
VVVDPTGSAYDISAYVTRIEVWKRENAVDNAVITLADTDWDIFKNKAAYDDDIALYLNYQEVSDPLGASDLCCYGYIQDLMPFESTAGQILNVPIKSVGQCLTDLLCGQQYGSESENSGLDTVAEIFQDNTDGLIDEWINSNNLGSGYTLDATLIEDVKVGSDIRYLYFSYPPVKHCIDTLIDYWQAIRGESAGAHYIIKTEETAGPAYTHYFMLTEVGDHASSPNVAAKWPTYWNTNQANSTLVVGTDQIMQSFVQQRPEANYVFYHGKFLYPPDGDIFTHNAAASWGSSGGGDKVFENDTDAGDWIVGEDSIHLGGALAGSTYICYYPSGQNLGLDLTKIGGLYNPATLNFYGKLGYASLPAWTRANLWTSAGNLWYADILGNIGIDRFIRMTLPVANYSPEAFPKFDGWHKTGNPAWNNINAIEFEFNPTLVGGGQVDIHIDGLTLAGHVIRGAKRAGQTRYKHKRITDDLAKDDLLKSGTPGTTDLGTLGRLAKAELYRAAATPVTGIIQIPAKPTILAGQFAHIHACKDSSGSYTIDRDMRVLTHHLILGQEGFLSELAVTDDCINSRPNGSFMSQYNLMLRSVNPEAQNRQISSIKSREIDITQTILEESYTITANWWRS